METRQLWLVAHLSESADVTRVEVVVAADGGVYIDNHPRRRLAVNIDVFSAFDAAKQASIRHYSDRIKQLRYLRDSVSDQQDPTCDPPIEKTLNESPLV